MSSQSTWIAFIAAALLCQSLVAEDEFPQTGFEGYRRGVWLTRSPSDTVVERIEHMLAEYLKKDECSGREANLPDRLSYLVWALDAEQCRFRHEPRFEPWIHADAKRLQALIAPWQANEKGTFSRMSSTKAVYDICRMMRDTEDAYLDFPEDIVSDMEKSVIASARDFAGWDFSTPEVREWLDTRLQPWRSARILTVLMAGYRLTGEKEFLEKMPRWLDYLDADIQDLGGLRYVSAFPYANVPWYTDMTLLNVGWLYLRAEGEACAGIRERVEAWCRRVRNNFVYRSLPPGTHDYSGTLWRKTTWRNPPGAFAPGAVALVTGDPGMATLTRYLLWNYTGLTLPPRATNLMTLEIASRIESIDPAPLPTRFLVADDSIRGVRGLNDDYAFVLNRCPGLFTVVGARVAAAPERRYLGYWGTYSTVLQGVTPEIGNRPWRVEDIKGNFRRDAFWRVPDEKPFAKGDRIVADRWAALGGSYPLKAPEAWQVDQVWLAVGRKLIGLVTVTSLREHPAVYVANRIHFGFIDSIEPLTNNVFRAGDFTVRLLDSNLDVVSRNPCEGYCNGRPDESRELRQADGVSHGPGRRYGEGETFYSLLEITSGAVDAGEPAAERIPGDAYMGFRHTHEGRPFVVLYRHQPGSAPYSAEKFGLTAPISEHRGSDHPDKPKSASLIHPNQIIVLRERKEG